MWTSAVAALLAAILVAPVQAGAQTAPPLDAPAAEERTVVTVRILFGQDRGARRAALEDLTKRHGLAAIPILILARRFAVDPRWTDRLDKTIAMLGKTPARNNWFDWMLWLQAQTDLPPFPGHAQVLAEIHARIDPDFRLFFPEGVAHRINLGEIAWGGVVKDGIPDLTNPDFLPQGKKPDLTDDELVFGVEINGDARAYPLRILDWHELFNDVIGGVPVTLAYCTLCGSGILYDGRVQGRDRPLTFGTSGFLYRSNKLMYDKATQSLWNQFTGTPVVGPLAHSGLKLSVRPVVLTRWADWRSAHPNTRVLSPDTGHRRRYEPGAAYGTYFASPDLMFPHRTDDGRLPPKAFVFALRGDAEKAWPLTLFEGGAVINDRAGRFDVVLVGNAAGRTVRAYRADGIRFAQGPEPGTLAGDGIRWRMSEAALVAEDGRRLSRLPGHVAYWFAFAGFLEGQGVLADG
ncbi:MAG: DUF3179 domain-containing protein [Alphaproteobacteria bacterium]